MAKENVTESRSEPQRSKKAQQSVAPEPMSQKEDIFEFLSKPFRVWIEYIRTAYKRYYLSLLKINLTALIAGWGLGVILLIIGLLIAVVLNGFNPALDPQKIASFFANTTDLIVVAAFLVVAIILESWLSNSIKLTAILYTHSQIEGADFSFWGASKKIKWKVLRYILIDAVLRVILLLPLILFFALAILGGFTSFGPSAGNDFSTILANIAALLLMIVIGIFYILVVYFLYAFLTQFWSYGFLINDLGIIPSLRRSLGIIRRRFIEVILFDVFWGVGILVLMVPLFVFSILWGFFRSFLSFLSTLAGLKGGIFWVFYILSIILETIVVIMLSTMVQSFSLPTQYMFWKKVKDY